MKRIQRYAARHASAMLAVCAGVFAVILKPLYNSPELPEELK
ncbi:hypothetical protein [Gorillibacterium sp. sgz5001074]